MAVQYSTAAVDGEGVGFSRAGCDRIPSHSSLWGSVPIDLRFVGQKPDQLLQRHDVHRLLCKWITGLLPIIKAHDHRRRLRESEGFE